MPTIREFIETYLSPADRLAEIVCGLVMVLTFTLTAGLTVTDGSSAVRALLLATLGCNVAWGIIDGVAYVMAQLLVRGRRAALTREIRQAPDERTALEVIARHFDAMLGPAADDQPRQMVYRGIRAAVLGSPERPLRIERHDLLGGLAILAIDFLCTVPAAVPFLLFSRAHVALRVSNAALIAILFAVGHRWAARVGTNRWLSGLALSAVGLALVAVAVALGG